MHHYDDDSDPRPRQRRAETRKNYPLDPDSAPTPTAEAFASRVQVTKTERAWIAQHLGPFHEGCVIEDVVRRLQAGKEATVYVCSGHAATGRAWLAAKLYRSRSLRGAQNIGRYQQGRQLLNESGRIASARTWRLHKAIAQGSRKGRAAVQTSWLVHEYELLRTLHARGAHVPEPIAHNEYALLMQLIGVDAEAAPSLNEVSVGPREAKRLFEQLLFDIELLLSLGWVHGDLSAHNLLYQPDQVVLIDFPQVVACQGNPDARAIFERDLARVSQYFVRAGVQVDPRALAAELWVKHVPRVEHAEAEGEATPETFRNPTRARRGG